MEVAKRLRVKNILLCVCSGMLLVNDIPTVSECFTGDTSIDIQGPTTEKTSDVNLVTEIFH